MPDTIGLKRPCRSCGGTGRPWTVAGDAAGFKVCKDCNGSGEINVPDTRELIAALNAAERHATEGPWKPYQYDAPNGTYSIWTDGGKGGYVGTSKKDVMFIGVSRNATRPLLDLLEECRTVCIAAKHEIQFGRDIGHEKDALPLIDALLAKLPEKK